MRRLRREVLIGCALPIVGGSLAGCTESPFGPDEGGSGGYAAFFALWDWAEEIAGGELSFENPIPVGRVGHGFDPDGDLVREIATTSTFIYLDTPEFGWAQNVASQLRSDYPSIAVIDGLAGFTREQLLAFERPDEVEPDHDHDWDPGAVEIVDVELIDANTGDVTADYHDDHWHGRLPDVPVDGHVSLQIVAEDADGRILPLGEEEPFQVDIRLAEDAPDDIAAVEAHADHVSISGIGTGRTRCVVRITADGTVVWEHGTDPLSVDVVEQLDAVDVDAFYDPHVWIDPVLAKDVVDTIADGLAEILPDAAATFRSNADSYNARLDAVDAQFREMMAEAERSIAVFAGHDSFRYLEHRYGFELHAPRGVSPDHQPSQSEIATTIDLIEHEGIDTILYDPFETSNPAEDVPALAETLLENSSASDVAPLTPTEGTTTEWDDRGWGWVEQMEEINLRSLALALGAT